MCTYIYIYTILWVYILSDGHKKFPLVWFVALTYLVYFQVCNWISSIYERCNWIHWDRLDPEKSSSQLEGPKYITRWLFECEKKDQRLHVFCLLHRCLLFDFCWFLLHYTHFFKRNEIANWKTNMFIGKSSINGPFSISMLNNPRIYYFTHMFVRVELSIWLVTNLYYISSLGLYQIEFQSASWSQRWY